MATSPDEQEKVERRSEPAALALPDDLLEQSTSQLISEISILESWLEDLKETRDDNPETILAKTTYTDMLLNRQELLNTLKQQ